MLPEQQPQLVAKGFHFTEGPVWHPDGYLLFSDIPGNSIYRYVPNRGVQKFVSPSRNSNGLTFDRAGRLLACEHGGRQVSRIDDAGEMRPLVESYDGKPFNSPNDVIVHSSGSIFFTDPPYGIDPEPGEQGFNGVYRHDPGGEVTLLLDDLERPNGLAFSPDETILYVADSRSRRVLSFHVNQDLTIGTPQEFANMDVLGPGNPDGIKVDTQGNVYAAAAGGIWVLEPSGNHVGTIEFPELPANLAFGGQRYRTLYVTARTGVYSFHVYVPGIPAF
jgi:gluconolactonase